MNRQREKTDELVYKKTVVAIFINLIVCVQATQISRTEILN